MRIVIAPDKFKGCLTAAEVAEALARGVTSVLPDAEMDRVPMADGGEGTVAALVAATGGRVREAAVTGPMGEPITAEFGLLGDGRTAVLEMAAASGLVLVPKERRDPLRASTRGTGELLRASIRAGVGRVILGIGGSATNDAGAGLGQALGFRLLDADGNELGPGGGELGRLSRIERPEEPPIPDGVEVLVACDVTNPLCGPDGASAVYGPQKGASPEAVRELDRNLARFAEIVARDLKVEIAGVPGSGAAGGLGGGLLAFAGARLARGVDLITEAVRLRDRLDGADLCLTGEGSMDGQTAFGKTAVGVSRLARSLGIPTFAFAGDLGEGVEAVLEEGITAYFSICPGPIALEDAVRRGAELLERAGAQAIRAFLAGRSRR
ncbi:Glycerate 2-kinase [Aquisphaera giovannonii]|uniref:Glycerate 2-kinase n=1 Tax=Aquisphaera giovannonii TaxID=406548 RepID=A0A5B9WAU4_9BACT|nr:glycerate kinase [Aquisphaera giovannonii]QEH37000.1 Glycerate 2-kinase [Aquisphaera giovannonii]